jgi:NAD(P)-dependent dehydrogenase (short-subunit alcohol dehydrogenase family)
VNCVAPGFVATRMHETTLAAGPAAAGADYFTRTRRELAAGGVPVGEAAELVCLLLGDREPVPFTGRLISAQWDPWRERSYHEQLRGAQDLATLRRIDGVLFAPVPVERSA